MRCGFCSTSLYVESRGTVRHFAYRPSVGPDEVDGHVHRWLFEQGVSTSVEVTGRRLVYYPFWRVGRTGRPELVPAAASPQGPLDDIRGLTGELVPYEESLEDGAVFVPTMAPPPADGDVWLVHVPVWHATFALGATLETVLVEATAGRAIAATAPPGTLGRPSRRNAWVLWGGGAVLVAVGGCVPWGWAALAGWLLTLAGVFLLLLPKSGGEGP